MSSQIGAVGTACFAVGVIGIENVSKGHDPFPQLLLGGLFTTGIAFMSQIDAGFAMGIAIVFLVSTLLLHSSAITNFLLTISSGATATSKGPSDV